MRQLPTGSCVLKQANFCVPHQTAKRQLPTGSCVLKQGVTTEVAKNAKAATYG